MRNDPNHHAGFARTPVHPWWAFAFLLAVLVVPACNDSSRSPIPAPSPSTTEPPGEPPGDAPKDTPIDPPSNPPAQKHRIRKGPYLQNAITTAVTIMWETDGAASGRVDYGPDETYGNVVTEAREATVQELRLEDLSPGTLYHYRVTAGSGARATVSSDGTFYTAPPDQEPFSMAVYGDSRTQTARHHSIAAAILKDLTPRQNPAIVLHTGDIVAYGPTYDQWGEQFFDPAADLLRTTAVYPVLGNHEANSDWYYSFFSVPMESSNSSSEAWYSFDYGCAHIVALDTCQDFSPTSPQYRWLVKDLVSAAAQSATWRFVFFHHPPFSSGYHGGDIVVVRYLVPVFEAFGIHIVFSGHEHLYERCLKNGITYVVTGGGGAPLYPVTQEPWSGQVHVESTYHYCLLRVSPSGVAFEARYPDGTAFDHFTMASGG